MTRGFVYFLLLALIIGVHNLASAQTGTVQVTGQVFDQDGEVALPYAHVLSSKWATTTNVAGAFKAPLERDDTIRISFVGFKDYKLSIPADLQENEYSITVLMDRDTIYLKEAEIFFLPENEEEFKQAIIELELDDKEYDYALRNISLLKSQLRTANYDKDEFDAGENARHYLAGPQPVYFNFVYDKIRAAMRKGKRRKELPQLEEINPSSFSEENNLVGISEKDQKAFSDSVRIESDSTFLKLLEKPVKENKKK